MAEFKEISPDAPAGAKLLNWFENRIPSAFYIYKRDLAGRVFKNKPAPDNLEVPPHMYLSDTKLVIGEDKKA